MYINDEMTLSTAKMSNTVKEHKTVKNVSTREGSILAWLHSRGRPGVINCPDDLEEVDISAPDWKKLNQDPLNRAYDGGTAQHILSHNNGVCVNEMSSVQCATTLDYIIALSFNVCGVKSELSSVDFVNFIQYFDVICLCDIINEKKNMEKYWF